MKSVNFFMIFCIFLIVAHSLQGVGLNPIKPYQLNKDASTQYLFSIKTGEEILNNAQIKVQFPSQFDQSELGANLECMSSSDSSEWRFVPCQFDGESVVLNVGQIRNEKMDILISTPKNPNIYEMSSYFQICLMYKNFATSCDKEFGKVIFPPAITPSPGTPSSPSVTSLSTTRVGKASTYEFKFSTSTNYPSGNTIRVTFPKGFYASANPICQMSGTYNEIIQTFTWPNKRSIECQRINKEIHTGETLKIIGINNPNYAGTFGNQGSQGFYIQILEGTTTVVKEALKIQQTINIQAGQMDGYIVQGNNFIKAKAKYTFYLNLQNALSAENNDYIQIKMPKSWVFYDNECSAVSGITFQQNQKLMCKYSADAVNSYLKFTNFLEASITNQLVFNAQVGTPDTVSSYPVNIITANDNGMIDELDLTVQLNSTYGTLEMLSINAITANAKVPVAQTGPLELTFFLNHQLPQTNVLTEGKFTLKIYPQIHLPPDNVNGVLKCYFFNDIPADTCTWDVSDALFTLVTIRTPQNLSFKYSEIPITITTEGATSEDKIGITISDKVTRYRFQLEAYKQDDLAIPTQVFYSEYIADSINFALTCTYLTKEVNQETAFKIQYTNPYDFQDPLMNNIRIKVEFLAGGGWASSLGYDPDQIYKNYPCIFYRTDDSAHDSNVRCDLYTYLNGPHASLTDISKRGPYILVYGFKAPLAINENYRFEFARFKIGSSHGTSTNLRVSIIEETPSMLTKYIELYFNEFEIFTTAAEQTTTIVANGVTLTKSSNLINTQTTHTLVQTVGTNSYYIVYEYDRQSTPEFSQKFETCTTTNLCAYFGYPVNWVIEYPSSSTFASSVTSSFTITNGIYAGTFSGLSRAFANSGLTIYKASFNNVYSPKSITSSTFSLSVANMYRGLQQYYSLSFTIITPTPSINGFLRLKLGSDIKFGPEAYCDSTNLPAPSSNLYSDHGIQCFLEDSGSTLKVYNYGALSAGNTYSLDIRLMTQLSAPNSFNPQITLETYYSLDVDYSVVDKLTSKTLNAGAQTNYYTIPNKFDIENPKVTQELPRVGYIGKLSFTFKPSTQSLAAHSIVIELPQHNWNSAMYTTPNNVDTDPLVCMINNKRAPCTYTLTSSLFKITITAQNLNSGTDNEITLDTEYLTQNGIKHPSQGGQYMCILQFYDDSSVLIESTSFFLKVLAPKFRNLYVESAMNDVGLENIFTFEIYIGSTTVANYDHSTRYGRIHFEFPTVDALGNTLFEDDLGGYDNTGQYVGCDFHIDTYYVDSPNNDMRCRLIKSEVPGDPAVVELLNFQKLDGNNYKLKVFIARIHNPTRAVKSVPLSVRMFEVEEATNNIYERYYETFDLFVNGQAAAPIGDQTVNCNSDSFQNGKQVGDSSAYFRNYPQIKSGSSADYYYVIKFPQNFIPNHRESTPFDSCSPTYFHECRVFPDISWVAVRCKANSQQFRVNMKLPDAISQQNYLIPSLVWRSKRYLYTSNINMLTSCQQQFRGTLSSYTGFSVIDDNSYGKDRGRRHIPIKVQFRVRHAVPKGGSIQIKFGTNVPQVYGHCRSMIRLGSVLTTEGSSANGQIGCMVQNDNSWVVTEFNALPASSDVILRGYIDFPTASNTYIGPGEVITYNNTHPTNIRANGFIIDYRQDPNFEIATGDEKSHNFDTQITLEETLPLRANYQGPLQFKFQLPSNFQGPNDSKIRVRIPKRSIYGETSGFGYDPTKKTVCKITDILTHKQFGCIIIDITDDTTSNEENILFEIISSSNLPSSGTYKMVINTCTGVQPQGLIFPTVPGTYKIDFSADIDNSGTFEVHDHLYLQVYGTPFTKLQVHSLVTLINKKNLIWVKMTPTTSITVTDQFVIEIPTRSAVSSTTVFDDDIGTGISDGDQIKFDIIGSDFNNDDFMKCRLFHGDQTNGKSARIICGGFSQVIDNSKQLYFGFVVENPSISGQMSVPFLIYSQNIDTMYKSNFNLVENAVLLNSTACSISQPGQIRTVKTGVTDQLQISDTSIELTGRNNWATSSQDYYTLFFNFPLRKNGIVSDGCTDASSTSYGDAYYHENLQVIVCDFVDSNMIKSSTGNQARTLKIKNFYSPWFYLSSAQQIVTTYQLHHTDLTKQSCEGIISDLYPNVAPKIATAPSLTITPIHSSTMYKGSRDDLKIEFQFQTSIATHDLSYVKLIAFIFPDKGFGLLGKDCVQAPSSEVQIQECWIEPTTRLLWIRPIQKTQYTDNKKIAIITQDLAISYPTAHASVDKSQFIVKYYSWQNIAEPSPTPLSTNTLLVNKHASMIINNFASSTISFTNNPSNPTPTFSYLHYPHQRHYNQIPYEKNSHRAPFRFILRPQIALTDQTGGANSHKIIVYYGDTFNDENQVNKKDLEIWKPVCYLANKRIKECSIDTTANKITMNFQFALSAGSDYHVLFSLIDPRNPNNFGFRPNQAISSYRVQYMKAGSPTVYYTETDKFPSHYSLPSGTAQGPFRGILDGTISYGHALQNQLNAVSMKLTFNRTDITGLVFEIPLKDKTGQVLYGSGQQAGAFLNLEDGSTYPCGNNGVGDNGNVKCILKLGKFSKLTKPTRIIMTDFTYSTEMNARFIFTNPSVIGSFFSIRVLAYGGERNEDNLYGNTFMGQWNFQDIFQVVTQSSSVTSNTFDRSVKLPSKSPWRNETIHYVFSGSQIPANRISLTKVVLYDSTSLTTDDQFCIADLGSGNAYDDLLQYTEVTSTGGTIKKYAYFFREWSAQTDTTHTTQTGWELQFLKCKYYQPSFISYWFHADDDIQIATNTFTPANANSLSTIGTSPINKYFDQNDRIDGRTAYFTVEMDLTPTITALTNFEFRTGDSMVLVFQFTDQYWTSISECHIIGGIIQTSSTQKTSCHVQSGEQKIYFKNVAGFESDPSLGTSTNKRVKFLFKGSSLIDKTTSSFSGFSIKTSLFSNLDAYTNSYQAIFSASAAAVKNYYTQLQAETTKTYVHTNDYGTFELLSAQDTSMVVAYKPQNQFDFTSVTETHRFDINFYGFGYGAGCSVSSIKIEISNSKTQGSGTTDTLPISTATCDNNHIRITTATPFANIWGGVGLGSDDKWGINQYVMLYLTIDRGTYDLPVLSHSYIYAVGAYNYANDQIRGVVGTLPTQELGSSAAIKVLTINLGVTQFEVQVNELAKSIGPDNQNYLLLAEFTNSASWSDPFSSYTNTQFDQELVVCKCISGIGPLAISTTTPYEDLKCRRRLPAASAPFNSFSILIPQNANKGQDVKCFFPEFAISSGMSFSVKFKLVYGDTYPIDLSGSSGYGSVFTTTSNSLDFTSAPSTTGITGLTTFTQSPNFYTSATDVGTMFSGATYELSGTWSANRNKPYIYLDLSQAGPLPIQQFCSNSAMYSICRVYSGKINLVVAQLKSTSATSFTMSKGLSDIYYPSSRYSQSSYFYRKAYISNGNQWSYISNSNRNQNSLTPIDSYTFKVYSDLYGSERSTFQNTLIFAINIGGKTLYSKLQSGSKIQITFSGITQKHSCQTWVEKEPQVELACEVTNNKIEIYSLLTDFSTSNNIFVSMAVTNPSSATFTMKLYDYYDSASSNSLVISKQASLTIDTSYQDKSQLDQTSVEVLPFHSRFSLVANSPLRIRFKLSTSTVAYDDTNSGYFQITYPQIAYSTKYLCFFKKFSSYQIMDQDTESVTYKATKYTVSSTTLKVYPPRSHDISASNFYELIIMPIGIDGPGCSALKCASQAGFQQQNFEQIKLIAYSDTTTPTAINQQVQKLYQYEGSSKINLNEIYVLCTKPLETTSLYVKFTLNFNSAHDFPDHYIEIILWDMEDDKFTGYTVKQQIPCQLSSNFIGVSNREDPTCVLTEADNVHEFIKIRIINLGSITQGEHWISLDDFKLPTPALNPKTGKFDLSIRYMGPSNLKYENYFREIFLIDDTHTGSSTTLSSASFLSPSTKLYGADITGQISFNWPFTTTSGTQSKLALSIRGGYSKTWADIDAVSFIDNLDAYNILWVNKKLNKFVLQLPSKTSNSPITLKIKNLKNPYPYQKSAYQSDSSEIQINFYENFFRHSSRTLSQHAFSEFQKRPSLVNVDQFLPSNKIDIYPSTGSSANKIAIGSTSILRLGVIINEGINDLKARQLDVYEIEFTSGVTYIEECRVVRNSKQYVNPLSTCQTSNQGGNWHITLYYMTESQITGNLWIQAVVKLNANTISYISRLKVRKDDVVEYQSTYNSVPMSSYFDSSNSKPTIISWLNRKYTKNYFENQWRYLEATSGQTTPYLRIRLTTDASYDGLYDDTQLYLRSTTIFAPGVSNHILVQLLPAVSAERDFGIGYWAKGRLDTDGSGHKYIKFNFNNNAWSGSKDFLLQIQQPNIVTTSLTAFQSPTMHQMTLKIIRGSTSDFDQMIYRPKAFFDSVSILHTTTTVDDYDTLTISYTPSITTSTSLSTTQTVVRLDVSGLYHEQDGGLKAIYSDDGIDVESGFRFSEFVSNSNNNEVTTVNFAQYDIAYTPLRFSLMRTSNYQAGTSYTWRIPLLKNPSNPYTALRYNLSLVHYPQSADSGNILNFYESVNEYYTVADTSVSFSPTVANTRKDIQVTNNIDLAINLDSYSLDQWDAVTFKLDNSKDGLIPDFTSGSDTSNYDYYYFHTIHMVMAQKKTSNSITDVGIGSSSSSINYQRPFKFSWVKVFDTSNTVMITNPKTLKYGGPASITLDYFTSYSSPSITKLQGSEYQGSSVLYKIDFTVKIIPEGGQIQILIDDSKIETDSGAHCKVHTNFDRSTSDSQVLRCFRFDDGFKIAGFKQITTNTALSVYIPVKSKVALTSQNIGINLYGIYQDITSIIAKKTDVVAITHPADSVPSVLHYKQEIFTQYFGYFDSQQNYYYEIQGNLNLRDTQLSYGDKLRLTIPWTRYGSLIMRIKQNTTTEVEWTQLTNSGSDFLLPQNFDVTHNLKTGIEYVWRLTTVRGAEVSSKYNGMVMQSWEDNSLQVLSYDSSTVIQKEYQDFTVTPVPKLLTIKNRYPAAGHTTMLQFQFQVDFDLTATNIWMELEFDSHNLLNQMFAEDLQNKPVNGEEFKYIDCREWNTNSRISNSRMKCLLYYGDNSADPPVPAYLVIPIVKTLNGSPTPFTMNFMVANVKNPSTEGMNVGVILKMYKKCTNKHNLKCALLEARGYYVTKSATENLQTSTSLFTPSSNVVLDTSINHVFSIQSTGAIGTSDVIYIMYPKNFEEILQQTCSVSNYQCYAFKIPRWIVLIPTTQVISGSGNLSISLNSYMNNGFYSQASESDIVIKVSRGSGSSVADTYNVPQNPFDPIEQNSANQATSMTIQATQNDDVFLRNYANTVEIKLDNIFMDSRIQAIYLKAPAQVQQWDANYCNVSITTTFESSKTYPLRFTCRHYHENTLVPVLQIIPETQELGTYLSAWAGLEILVHAKFTLKDFSLGQPILYTSTPTSTANPFQAFGSVSTTSDDAKFYLSRCQSNILISQHLVPIISDITFNRKSFADRTARVSNKEVFYLLLKPTLSGSTISKMVFEIPNEFDYPGIFEHDNCFMIGRSKVDQDSCKQSRENGKTLITIVPDVSYDNDVKIIQLGSVSEQNWFTAPQLPGNFYQMTVQLYDTTQLLQKQTIDISPVYGESFQLTTMSIDNIRQSDVDGSLYDIQFITGSLQIPPGAPTSSTTLSSQLQFIFQNYNPNLATNVFANDLKTGLQEGDEVGCVIKQGLTAIQGKRLKCILHVGTNSTDKPIIKIVNYNLVDPQTSIKIAFAGIQPLQKDQVNTISIGVLLNYADLQSSTYLYIPTAKVPQPTTDVKIYDSYTYTDGGGTVYSNWTNYWYWQYSIINYNGNNIVRQPTNFTVQVQAPYDWPGSEKTYSSTGTGGDFILIKIDPKYLIDPYNIVPISCSICLEAPEVFYAGGIVRFRYSGTISGSGETRFYLNNFPSSAYSLNNQQTKIDIELYDDYRLVEKHTVNPTRTVQKCQLFDFDVLSVSSLNGGEIGVTYTFSMITNHFIPENGAVSITIPQSYGDMVSNGVTCTLQGFEDTNAYCLVNTPSTVDIYLNGSEISQSASFKVILDGLQNPNEDSSSLIFYITSYFDSNTYLGHKICQNSVTPPAIIVKQQRTCTLSWTSSFSNKNYNATHSFVVSCSDLFRGSSFVYITLPDQFSNKNNLGDIKCSSLESTTLVDDVCHLSFINGTYRLWTQIEATSQSSLSIIVNLINPTNNTYSAKAEILSKGVIYANTETAYLTILSTNYQIGNTGSVFLMNSPKQAGLMATYIFQISPMFKFTPQNLAITFPDNFYFSQADLTVGLATSENSRLFNELNYDRVQKMVNNVSAVANITLKSYPNFSMNNFGSLLITNISSWLNASEWTYVFIRGIKNPSAYISSNFTVAYYSDFKSYQTLSWVINGPLSYKISSPPKYLSISSVEVSDNDILYPSVYKFKIKSGAGQPIGIQGVKLSYVIVLPNFYKNTVWANGNFTCKFDEMTTNSACENYETEIIVTQTFPTDYYELTLTIQKILNPSLETYCDTDDVTLLSHTFFRVRIIEVQSNKFMFESSSVVDGSNCLKFSSSRIPISLEHSLVMTAGLAYNLTYSIIKPAMNLKIRAISSNPGFTFSPKVVQFDDYYTLKKTTTIYLRSDIAPGNYTISFEKFEADVNTYFRNILPATVQIVSPESSNFDSPTITIPSLVKSTIGYPVSIPIEFSLPSSTPMTLSIRILEENDQTLEQYSPFFQNFKLEPRVINIQPQQQSFSFVITHRKQVVPPKLTLNFTLISVYPIIHDLQTPQITLCFNQDPTFDVLYPPLKVSTTTFASACDESDVGKKVTNIFVSNKTEESSQSEIIPEVIKLEIESTRSTSATINIFTRTSGNIYYLCIDGGYPMIQDQQEIFQMKYSDIGFTGSTVSQAQNIYKGKTAQINYKAQINVELLQSKTGYTFYAIVESELGVSVIKKISFKTTDLSRGISMKLSFSDIPTKLEIVKALQRVFRIAPLRLSVLTSPNELQKIKDRITSNHNDPQYIIEVVVAPDPTNDTKTPMEIVKEFKSSQQSKDLLKEILPQWNINSNIIYHVIRPTKPRVAELPTAVVIRIYSATFRMKFWERANVYAVILRLDEEVQDTLSIVKTPITVRRYTELSQQEREIIPSSQQIMKGKNKDNQDLGKYEAVSVQTEQNGNVALFFDDLKEGSKYVICITSSDIFQYPPPTVWEDQQIIIVGFTTIYNPNLKKSNRHIDQLKELNPGMGEAIQNFIKANQKKKNKGALRG